MIRQGRERGMGKHMPYNMGDSNEGLLKRGLLQKKKNKVK